MRLVPVLLLLACTDYNLHGEKDRGTDAQDDSGDGINQDTDFSDICDGLTATPHAVELNYECDVSLQEGSFTPVVEFNYGSGSFCGPPAVGQIVDTNGSGAIDDEDLPAILLYQGGSSGGSDGRVVALKGDGSGEFWESQRGLGQDGGFAVGDIDADGWPDVVAAGSTKVTALDGRTGAMIWQRTGLGSSLDPMGYSYPSIADMDGDGAPEVTVGNTILNGADGSIRGQGTLGMGAAPYEGTGAWGNYGALSVPLDLDGDGRMELVTGNAAYKLDGSVKWTNSGLDGLVAVADFDGDGEGEIVKTSGIYVTGMESDGTEVWGPLNYNGATNTNLGAPSVDDIDADGVPDIVFAAQNYLIAMDWGGTEKWRARIADQSGAAGPVFFDFELDGYPEVLYADETTVRFFSGLDGSVKFSSSDHGSYTILETPIVADVDNDDQVEIVLGHCTWGTASLTVYGDANESWPPGRKTWNQHAYTITNIGDLGDVPTSTAPNWPEYNSFRSGDVGQPPGEWHDVSAEIFDVCETECGDDKVYVGAWVLNAGNLEVPAGIPVSLRAGGGGAVLDTQYTTVAIPSGEVGEALIFELSASALGSERPVAVADYDSTGAGVLFECNEDNNAQGWGEGTCQ